MTEAKPRPSYARTRAATGQSAGEKRVHANPRLFTTREAKRSKEEICAVGRKLWLRQLVDGNGGNISCRIGPNEVLCTPTLISKYDLTPADVCMVDLGGNRIAGKREVTSEILLHLEIYKKVPGAKAAVHCHPPHATAYAITNLAPAGLVLPEYEIFVGQVAIAPYETPGTEAFARTVLPFIESHNAVLLANHGVICWADSVTVAEWQCEILESYCTVLGLAQQLGRPLSHIPELKGADLRALRKRMGFPDASGNGKLQRGIGRRQSNGTVTLTKAQLESMVKRVAREILKEAGRK